MICGITDERNLLTSTVIRMSHDTNVLVKILECMLCILSVYMERHLNKDSDGL